MKKFYIIIICFLFFNDIRSQNWIANVEEGAGFILVHREKMEHLAQSHPNKIELSLQKQTDGSKDWHEKYNLPRIGYSAFIVNYNNDVLGKTLGGNLQFIYPAFKKEKIRVNTIIGIGAGYNTRPYDRIDNYQNNVLGSKFTGSLHGKVNLEYFISERIGVHLGIGLIHFSNGAAKLPNLGINVPYMHLGLQYSLSGINMADAIEIKNPIDIPKFQYTIGLTNGWKDVVYSNGKKHWFNVLTFKAHRNMSDINRLTIGTEFFTIDQLMNLEQILI